MADATLDAQISLTRGSFSLEVALAVAAGEVLALVGPNGSGKTTCLEVLAGLARADRARIVSEGVVLEDTARGIYLGPAARRIGMVFQDFALFPHQTVRGNVAYGPRSRKANRADCDRIVRTWLERLDLTAVADRPVQQLSGGQKQRVALARALAAEARVLLLDEPFASLDVTTRAALRSELRDLLRRLELPALFVTHDPLDAFVVGDRLAVLEAGRVVQVGRGEDLVARPGSPFVASLLGLNFYDAELGVGAGLREARVGPVTFHVLADAPAGRAHLAFAPSDVALTPQSAASSAQNDFEARVRDLASLPDRVRVSLDAGVPMAADITREASERLGLAPGRSLRAVIKATSIRVYP